MSIDSAVFSVEKTCRTCLGVINMESISLLEDVFIVEKSIITIKDFLNTSCCLKISENDGLPYRVCSACMDRIKDILIFRTQCENSERMLREYLIENKQQTHETLLENLKNNLKYDILDVIVDEVTLNDNATLLIVEEEEDTKTNIENQFEDVVFDDGDYIMEDDEDEMPLNELASVKEPQLAPTKNKTFHCTDCDITFAWRMRYMEHLRKFHKHVLLTRKRRQYKCGKCSRAFSIQCNMEQHELECDVDPIDPAMLLPMDCAHCSRKFENAAKLSAHIVLEHPEYDAHVCHCGKTFKFNGELRAHLRSHVKDTKYDCAACNKVFCNEANLEKHIRRQHTNEHLCLVCNKTFDNKRKLRLHKTCHTAESDKRYKCKYCIKKFNQIHHLQNHERIHTGQKPFLCNICGKGFRQQYALTLHMRTHSGKKPYACTECDKSFNRKQGLDTHMSCHDGEIYMCSECGIRLSRLRTLMKHMWQVHKKGEDPSLSPVKKINKVSPTRKVDGDPKKDVTYTCNVCRITLDSNPALKQHMRTHALQHVCNVCSRAFMLPAQLAAHMRFHNGAKLHSCLEPGCNRTFNRPEHVKSHYMRAHTSERPYQCEVCLKGFCQTGDLKVHMRYHTGERPYECTFCDKAFAASSALRGHMRRHTGEKPYRCAICQRGYYTSTELNLHMRSHTSKQVEISTDVPPSNELVFQQ